MKRGNKHEESARNLSKTAKGKLLMLACLTVLLGASSFVIFLAQSTVGEDVKPSQSEQSVSARQASQKRPSLLREFEASRESERVIATNMEEDVRDDFEDLIAQIFEGERGVIGSIHYDLVTIDNPEDISRRLRQVRSGLPDVGQSPVESYIKLVFDRDELLQALQPETITQLRNELIASGLINPEERSSFLLLSPQKTRNFIHSGGNDSLLEEEVAAN